MTNCFSTECSGRKLFLLSFLLGLLVWLPWFLCFYPGVLTPDSVWQMAQVMGVKPYQDQHPWLHTLLIRLLWNFGSRVLGGAGFQVPAAQMTGAQINLGVATYTAFSQILMAGCFSWIIVLCERYHVKKVWRIFLWLFYFGVPYNALYAVTMIKNVPFSAAVLLFTAFLFDHIESRKVWTRKDRILLGILGFLFCLLTSNGLIAFLFFVICFAIGQKKVFRKLALTFLLTIALAVCFKGPLERVCGVESADVSEALSVPLQQVARVIYDDGSISAKQLAAVNEIFDTSIVKDPEHGYRPDLSDPIKDAVKAKGNSALIRQDPGKYLKLWLDIGAANPGLYVKAYFGLTEGYWWPHIGAKQDYSTEVMTNELNITRDNRWSNQAIIVFYNFLTNFTRVYVKIWSTGSSAWAVLAAFVIAVIRKRPRYVFAPFIGVWLTVLLATPIVSDLRYIYCMFLGFIPLFYLALGGTKLITENAEAAGHG